MNLRTKGSARQKDASPRPGGDLRSLRDETLRTGAIAATAAMTIYTFIQLYTLYQDENWSRVGMLAAMILLLAMVSLIEKIGYRTRVIVLLSVLLVESLYMLITAGIASNGLAMLMAVPILAAVLMGWRQGTQVYILTAVIVAGFSQLNRITTSAVETIPGMAGLTIWTWGGMVYLIGAGVILVALYPLLRGLENALAANILNRNKLEAVTRGYQQEINGKVLELQKRTSLLESAQEFSSRIDEIRDPDRLINFTVEFIKQLGPSAVQCYRFSPEQEQFTLVISHVSEEHLLTGQKAPFRLGQQGTPGAVVDLGGPVEFRNQGDAAFLFGQGFNPSAGAVLIPLSFEEKLEAILLVFHQEGVNQTLMDLYISMTQRLNIIFSGLKRQERYENQLNEYKASSEKALRQSWRLMGLKGQQKLGYRFSHNQLESAVEPSHEARQVVSVGKPLITTASEPGITTVVMPILFQGSVMGALDIRFEGQYVPKDMVQMIAAVSKRLSVALENARLMEEIQLQAEREHELGEITTRVRANTEIEGILKAAATEIGRALRVSDVIVQLKPDE